MNDIDVIIITGQSGVGKTILIDMLIKQHPELKIVISATTRQIRTGEINGENRIFVTRKEFDEMVANGELACLKQDIQGNCYAIPKNLNGNIIDLDLQGIKKFKAEFPNLRILSIGLKQHGLRCFYRMLKRGDKLPNIFDRIRQDKAFKEMDEVVDSVYHPKNQTVEETADAVWRIIMNKTKTNH